MTERPLFWIIVGTGALWTIGLLYFAYALRRDPARGGMIGKTARAAGPGSAAVVCALLTTVLALVAYDGKGGWLEVAVLIVALGFLVRWALATVRVLRTVFGRRADMRRKPEQWHSLNASDRKDAAQFEDG